MSAERPSQGFVTRFMNRQQWALLLRELDKTYDVYGPRRRDDSLLLARLNGEAEAAGFHWNDYRLPAPLKPLWFQPATVLARWAGEAATDAPPCRPRAVVGAKACDLVALRILDCVFRDFTHREPAYCLARQRNLIVSGDCTSHAESCFCTLLGNRPYPMDLFDLNLSPAGDGYVVEAGSERGQAMFDAHDGLFREARREEIEARDLRRHEITRKVERLNERFATKDPIADSIRKNLKTRIWGDLAARCVECNACNYICPTCHCFLLHDCKVGNSACRVGLWDSCFHAGYARMAGGATPRLQLTERFKNHYYHKFVAYPENWGIVACTGCGRCVDACMGRIDKRECLRQLETRWIPSEVVEEL